MIDATDRQVEAWITAVLGDVPVSFAPPVGSADGAAESAAESDGINCYLLDLLPSPPPSGNRIAPLQFSVRYLVTAWSADAATAHQRLGALVFAALDHDEYDADLEPVPPALWHALGVRPRPAFFLRTLVRRPRPEPDVRYVRQPLVVRSAPAGTLVGIVHGPNSVPLAGARVELPALQRSTYADASGHFHFATVPLDPPLQLIVRAKGRVHHVTVDRPTSVTDPLIITLALDT